MRTGTSLIPIALGWYDKGVLAIPLHWRTKVPTTAWGHWRTNRPSRIQVIEAFDTRFYRNIAIICGPVSGNLVVLDFDKPLPFFNWYTEHGIDTYIVSTSRGFHVYVFLADPPTRSLGMGWGEVKVTGYVVAPPSVHPSGVEYAVYRDDEIWRTSNMATLGITPPITSVLQSGLPKSLYRGSCVEQIKTAFPIAVFLHRYTELRPSGADGRWLIGRCVFHHDDNPSMWVDTQRDRCGCFVPGCRAHDKYQDVINIFAHITGVTNEDAIRQLSAMVE